MPDSAESFEPWFAGKTFTTDWSSRAFSTWSAHLSHLRKEPINILEIGAWEGRGSLFFLNYFPRSTVTCIDIFSLGNGPLFDANVMADHAARVTKIAGRSTVELDALALAGAQFDLIYVDGSHDRDDVMIDSLLSWRLLKVGGVMIWDDYEIVSAMPGVFGPDQDPKPSIDVFLGWRKDELEILHSEYQVIVRKLKPHYTSSIPVIESAGSRPPGKKPFFALRKALGLS